MEDRAKLRKRLRQQGILSPGCKECAFLKECGGHNSDFSLLNCFDFCCSGKKRCGCEGVCPRKPDFADRFNEVGGFGWADVGEVSQHDLALPEYIPLICHRSRRTGPLHHPVVALDTYKVIRLKGGRYKTVADNGADLRKHFRLAADTQIVLRGTSWDGPLELYWENRAVENAAEQLRALDVLAVIGPNFSHFLNVPRTDNLFNRKRQLLCLAELSNAGNHTIPHLNAIREGDWRFWQEFLTTHKTIRHVAIEFQTGNRTKTEGAQATEATGRSRQGHWSAITPDFDWWTAVSLGCGSCVSQPYNP